MQDFRNLKVWEKSHALVLALYTLTRSMPREETYGLVAQIRRTAMNVPMRIADSCGQPDDDGFRRQLWLAMASARELEYQLLLARDLQYCDEAAYSAHQPAIIEIQKMLSGLLTAARRP